MQDKISLPVEVEKDILDTVVVILVDFKVVKKFVVKVVEVTKDSKMLKVYILKDICLLNVVDVVLDVVDVVANN